MLTPRRALLAATALLIAVMTGALSASDVIEQVLVRVNGEIVTKTEFEQRQISALRQRQEFANGNPNDAQLKKAIADITPDLILSVVDELIMIQRGKEMGFSLSDAQFAS